MIQDIVKVKNEKRRKKRKEEKGKQTNKQTKKQFEYIIIGTIDAS